MKTILRIVRMTECILILYADGLYSKATDTLLREVFEHIADAETLHGTIDGWELDYTEIDEYPGITLAWIDDNHILHITRQNPFSGLLNISTNETTSELSFIDYITVDEYAKSVGRTGVRVRVLCREGRFPTAIQKGGRWLIPRDTPFPSDNRFVENPKRPRKPKTNGGEGSK